MILQVSDATSPNAAEQQEQVQKVLSELEAQHKPTIRVLNKIDLLAKTECNALPADDDTVQVSGAKGIGLDRLLARIDSVLTADPVGCIEVSLPQSEGKLLAMIEAKGKILGRDYRRDQVQLTVEGPQSLLRHLRNFDTNRNAGAAAGRASNSRKLPARTHS